MSLPTFSFSTTADEVATALRPKFKAKNVLVTGTSINGIGFEAARVIAKHAQLVVITGYNLDRLRLSEEAIKKDVPTANIRPLVLDLSSLAAVRKAAAEINGYPEALHVVVHNAAASFGPLKLTVDNLERQMATDHIGPFLLTKLIASKILAAGTESYVPRVVYVSSNGHTYGTGVNFATIGHPDAEKYQSGDAYFQAKSANCLMAIGLSSRSKGKINAYSLHPGLIFTNISVNKEAIPDMQAFGVLDAEGTPSQACRGSPSLRLVVISDKMTFSSLSTVAAAFDTRLNDKPGAYLSDGTEANKERADHSSDPANAEKLWTVTEEVIGENFTF
ncbi:hypothetical protein B0H17DRAFT_1201293 [Mycena rosella]|uniref:Short-chain dehydrogenase/reductase family protein n=1 Tax=Mycena rosella TaxID=1033263 RepID=A0AAD7DGJ1_MYCRO|nr:hypothetical protein B0H17DRAFT_1201293 [Mycena rosella]